MTKTRFAHILLATLLQVSMLAGQEITAIEFDTIPEGATLTSGEIVLDGDTRLGGTLEFPDGTTQVSAGGTVVGDYTNRIRRGPFPTSFTEICFVGGQILFDIHAVGETTEGGSCEPGMPGFVIERDERSAATWVAATAVCLAEGMRLPSPFEWQYSCFEATDLALNDMADDLEFVSAVVTVDTHGDGTHGPVVPTFGDGSCEHGRRTWIARSNGSVGNGYAFRCAR